MARQDVVYAHGLAPEEMVNRYKDTLASTLASYPSKASPSDMTLAEALREMRRDLVESRDTPLPRLVLNALTKDGDLLPAILNVALTADPVKEARWAYQRRLNLADEGIVVLPCGLALVVCSLICELQLGCEGTVEGTELDVMWAQVAPVLPRLLSLVSTTLSTLVPLFESSTKEGALPLNGPFLTMVVFDICRAMDLFFRLPPAAHAHNSAVYEVRCLYFCSCHLGS
jgi:hypothetical protein